MLICITSKLEAHAALLITQLHRQAKLSAPSPILLPTHKTHNLCPPPNTHTHTPHARTNWCRTGGLADTVHDMDDPRGAEGGGNGYVFDGSNDDALHGALDRALALFKDRPADFAALSLRNLRTDVSWGKSGKQYVDLYSAIAMQE